MTNNTAIQWLQQNAGLLPVVYNNDSINNSINVPVQHGAFTIRLTMVSADGYDYTSTATVNASSLGNITTITLTCDDNGDGIGKNALLINGKLNTYRIYWGIAVSLLPIGNFIHLITCMHLLI